MQIVIKQVIKQIIKHEPMMKIIVTHVDARVFRDHCFDVYFASLLLEKGVQLQNPLARNYGIQQRYSKYLF